MSRKIFISFRYESASDASLAHEVHSLVASHGLGTMIGRPLGGDVIPAAVKERICTCDALIALLTRREALPNGNWTTHEWVKNELNFARERRKYTLSLVEVGVDIGGMYQDYEFIRYEREENLRAFLDLSWSIKEWKQKWGHPRDVRLQPDEIAKLALDDTSKVSYRLYNTIGDGWSDWFSVRAVGRPGGIFVHLNGVHEDCDIQFQIQHGNRRFMSDVEPQWIKSDLRKVPLSRVVRRFLMVIGQRTNR